MENLCEYRHQSVSDPDFRTTTGIPLPQFGPLACMLHQYPGGSRLNTQSMVAVIGAGPAGLMAAETLSERGIAVAVYDAMPSAGRKLLMAGRGGLNLTHSEPLPAFSARYRSRQAEIRPWLEALGPAALRTWVHGLGVNTFVGTSGRVFPEEMKAAPLLRAWLHRLRGQGVKFHMRHRWVGWGDRGGLRFDTPTGRLEVWPSVTILALGGGSWPRLGSDGAWTDILAGAGVPVAALRAANCGFDVPWSDSFRERFGGLPVKAVSASFRGEVARGELMVTEHGIEGGLVYALSAALRDAIETEGAADLLLDLLPDHGVTRIESAIARRGRRSLSTQLQSRLGLKGVKYGLVRECLPRETTHDPAALAMAIKALPLHLTAPRPLAEAISSAGGVLLEALDDRLMVRGCPGLFCCGEMLDWEAPTGGYLLSACFASGRVAGLGARSWLARPFPAVDQGESSEGV